MLAHSRFPFVLLTSMCAFLMGAHGQETQPQGNSAAAASPSVTDDKSAAAWWDSDVWKDSDRGFNWYPPDRPKPQAVKPDARKPELKAEVKRKNIREIKDLDELQKELKRLKEEAIFDPTSKKVHMYLQAQEYVMAQSQLFADTARRVVWQNPDVDYTAKAPQAAYSVTNQRIRVTNRRYEILKEVGKTHGLLYFFKSDCAFCSDMSPVMKAMESQYGIEVLAISLDGRATKDFPAPKRDNGISKFVSRGEGITTVPAVYLVSNDKKTVMLLGTGALAMDEVAERVRVMLTTKVGEDY